MPAKFISIVNVFSKLVYNTVFIEVFSSP